jgi:Calcineurin-like phosphoesterase/Purple acid Phosphatase, N-terminal domain
MKRNIRGSLMHKKIRKFGLNLFLSVLVLSPIYGYIGYSYTSLQFISFENSPFVHWSGLNPHKEVYITWKTAQESGSFIKFGVNPNNLDQEFENSTLSILHRVQLINLSENTRYYYQVGPSIDAESIYFSQIQSFKTAPLLSKEFNATFISDTQQLYGIGAYDRVGEAIKKMGDTDFVSIIGDLVQELGNQQHWNQFFGESVYKDRAALVPAPGNHDNIDSPDALYVKYFGFTANNRDVFYSFNWSNTQFVIAQFGNREHCNLTNPRNADHLKWLNQTLENGLKMDYRILIFHINRMHVIAPIVEKYNVSLAIHGHAHQYTRSYYKNHTYLCLGNGATIQETIIEREPYYQAETNGVGFTQIKFNSTGIKIETFNPTLEIMDSVFLRRENPTSGILIPDHII